MREWIADRLDAVSMWVRGDRGVSWGAVVSGDEIIVRSGQPIHLHVLDGKVTLDLGAVSDVVNRPIPDGPPPPTLNHTRSGV